MGGVRNAKLNKQDDARTRRAEKREQQRKQAGKMDVNTLPWLTIVALVAEMAANDGAIRIGLTRDGGALALGMYMDDDYATEYIRPSADIEAALHEIADVWLPDGLLGLERRMAAFSVAAQPPTDVK